MMKRAILLVFSSLKIIVGGCDKDPCATDSSITSFTLVRFDETEMLVLTDSMRLDHDSNVGLFKAEEGPRDIRANVSGTVGSVHFEMTGSGYNFSRTANTIPYLLYDDPFNTLGGRFYSQKGFYTLTATPYQLASMGGAAGTPLTITVEVYNSCTEDGEASNVVTTPSTSANSSDGTAIVHTPIGSPDYFWSHDPNLQGADATGLAPGTYEVTFGNLNCMATIAYTISTP